MVNFIQIEIQFVIIYVLFKLSFYLNEIDSDGLVQ